MASRHRSPTDSGGRHEALVLGLLRANGPLDRSGLRSLSGLSRTTLYDTVAKLVADGAVVVSTPHLTRRGRGRPVERLDVNPRVAAPLGQNTNTPHGEGGSR
ncbi:hypothetical protein [Streptomyces sp. NPDC057877]|uniref:hypothetical protein n=1 Tax=Streptomyces sp. NPDC057877 TaxID=3346269 RepID=UPI00367F3B81